MAVRSRRVSRGTVRRKLVWARTINPGAAIPAGAGETFNWDLLQAFRDQVSATLPGLTVMRIRGSLLLADVSGQSRMVTAGVRVYNRSATNGANDLLEVEGPITDEHADWMLYTTAYATTSSTVPVEIDVKAMRKLEETSQSLMVSLEAADALAASVRFSLSVLVALP